MPENCNPKDCPLTPRVEALERESKHNTEAHKEFYARLNKVEQDNAVQNEQYKTIIAKLDALTAKVEQMESKPAKRWEGLADKALWAVAAAVIAFLLGRLEL